MGERRELNCVKSRPLFALARKIVATEGIFNFKTMLLESSHCRQVTFDKRELWREKCGGCL